MRGKNGLNSIFLSFSAEIGFEVRPSTALFSCPGHRSTRLRRVLGETPGGSRTGSLLFRSANRLPNGSLFKSSMKSSGPSGSWCHAPKGGAWRLSLSLTDFFPIRFSFFEKGGDALSLFFGRDLVFKITAHSSGLIVG